MWTEGAFHPTCQYILLLSACATRDLSKPEDSIAPSIRITQPTTNARVEGDKLTIEVEYSDEGSGVAVNSFRVLINEQDHTKDFDQHSSGATGKIRSSEPLPLGENRLTVEVADRAGNKSRAEATFLYAGQGWLTLGASIKEAGRLTALAFSPDGTRVAVGRSDGTIHLWNVSETSAVRWTSITAHTGPVSALAYGANGQTLVSAGWDKTIRLWNQARSDVPPPLFTEKLKDQFVATAFSSDGRLLAVLTRTGGVQLWEVMDRAFRRRGALTTTGKRVVTIAFSPHGQTLATGTQEGSIVLWDVSNPQPTKRLALEGHESRVTALAFGPQENLVVSGSWDGTVRLWEKGLSRRQGTDTLQTTGTTLILAVSQDGKIIVSAGRDGNIIGWDVSNGSKSLEARLMAPVRIAVGDARGSAMAFGYDQGKSYLVQLTRIQIPQW